MKMVVIGGTGLTGSKAVAILRQGGHEVVSASRKYGVDTVTGAGLKEAIAGAQVVIDLSNAPSSDMKQLRKSAGLGHTGGSGRGSSSGQVACRFLPAVNTQGRCSFSPCCDRLCFSVCRRRVVRTDAPTND